MAESPKVYLILGPNGSGRRALLADFIDSLESESSVLYFKHRDEIINDYDSSLESLNASQVLSYGLLKVLRLNMSPSA